MATKNPRINVTFEEAVSSLIEHLARQEHRSVSGLVRELVLEALEMREDFYLSQLAVKLDKEETQTYDHDDAWK